MVANEATSRAKRLVKFARTEANVILAKRLLKVFEGEPDLEEHVLRALNAHEKAAFTMVRLMGGQFEDWSGDSDDIETEEAE